GTGQTTAQLAINALAGAQTSGQFLRGNGTNILVAAITASDLPTGTTSAQGALQLDGTTGDIAASPGTAAYGSIGKAADAGHVHPQPTNFAPGGLTGAATASRYVGATTSGAPASGTFSTGDFVIDQSGKVWICTSGGTSGTWVALSPGAGPYATQTLGSPAASITFSSIPGGYGNLRVLAVGASNTAAETTRWNLRFNGDSGNHYDMQSI